MGNVMLRRSMKIVGRVLSGTSPAIWRILRRYIWIAGLRNHHQIIIFKNHLHTHLLYSTLLYYFLKRTRSLASLSDHVRCFTSMRLVGCARQRSRLLLQGCFAASGLLSVTRRRQCQLRPSPWPSTIAVLLRDVGVAVCDLSSPSSSSSANSLDVPFRSCFRCHSL